MDRLWKSSNSMGKIFKILGKEMFSGLNNPD